MGCSGLRILWTRLPRARTVVALFVLASVAGVVGGDDEQDGPWILLPPTSVDGFRIDATFSRGVEARDPPPLQHHALRTPRGDPSWRAATTANAVRAVQSLVCGAFDLSPLLEDDTVLAPALLRPPAARRVWTPLNARRRAQGALRDKEGGVIFRVSMTQRADAGVDGSAPPASASLTWRQRDPRALCAAGAAQARAAAAAADDGDNGPASELLDLWASPRGPLVFLLAAGGRLPFPPPHPPPPFVLIGHAASLTPY